MDPDLAKLARAAAVVGQIARTSAEAFDQLVVGIQRTTEMLLQINAQLNRFLEEEYSPKYRLKIHERDG